MSKAFVKETGDPAALDPEEEAARDEEERRPAGPRYITPEGYRRLVAELDELLTVQRRKVVEEVAAAAALGDRSENAEYLYGKKKLREIDRRARHLTRLLDRLTVVDGRAQDAGRVYFGVWVTIRDEDGARRRYRIVGPDEIDLARGHISVESPLARALLGRRRGDVVEVRRPKGATEVEVVRIEYGEPAPGANRRRR